MPKLTGKFAAWEQKAANDTPKGPTMRPVSRASTIGGRSKAPQDDNKSDAGRETPFGPMKKKKPSAIKKIEEAQAKLNGDIDGKISNLDKMEFPSKIKTPETSPKTPKAGPKKLGTNKALAMFEAKTTSAKEDASGRNPASKMDRIQNWVNDISEEKITPSPNNSPESTHLLGKSSGPPKVKKKYTTSGRRTSSMSGMDITKTSARKSVDLAKLPQPADLRVPFDKTNSLRRPSRENLTITQEQVQEAEEEWTLVKLQNGIDSSDSSSYEIVDAAEELEQLRVDDDLPDELWEKGEKLWLIHRAGIASCRILPKDAPSGHLMDGKTKVRLEQDGSVLIVDEAATEPANHPDQDRCEDITHLTFLNESSSLHTLRQRLGGKLIHTFCGNQLITINPRHSLAAYSDKVISMFRGCRREELPPHIYATAQSAYRRMLKANQNQAICPIGISGAGKSIMVEHTLNYLLTVSNTSIKKDVVNAAWMALESVSCVESPQGRASSKDVKLFHLDYDKSGSLVSIDVQSALLDKEHITSSSQDQSNFLALHILAEGAKAELRKDLFMNDRTKTDNRYLPPTKSQNEPSYWVRRLEKFNLALKALDAEANQIRYIMCLLAAILHLGCAGSEKTPDGKRFQYSDPESAQRAAAVLGIPQESLQKYIFEQTVPGRPAKNTNLGQAAIDAFAQGLYCEVYQIIYSIVNAAFKGRESGVHTITVVDIPGYQLGKHQSLSSLLFNYTNDRLMQVHDEKLFQDVQKRYEQEGLELDLPVPDVDLSASVDLVDRQNRSAYNEDDAKGILWMLEEEALYPNSSAETFTGKVLTQYGIGRDPLVLPATESRSGFKIRHQHGQFEAEYESASWLMGSREAPPQFTSTANFLSESKKVIIQSLAKRSNDLGGDFVRVGTIRRSTTSGRRNVSSLPATKRKSPTLQAKVSVDLIVDKLRRCEVHFVNALSPTIQAEQSALTDMPFLRMQIRGLRLVESGRFIKQGFPDSLNFDEFMRQFGCLVKVYPNDYHKTPDIVKLHCDAHELERTQYKIGRSKIFFRTGIIAKLETRRNKKLNILLSSFQARCKGYLQRKKFEKRKVGEVAARTIQRNIRSYMERKSWPWWKLYTNIIPLIETHRADVELHEKTTELEKLKHKFELLEEENARNKERADKLNSKVEELTHDLIEEQNANAETNEQLEIEIAERRQVQLENRDLKARADDSEKRFEEIDIELAELRQRHNHTVEQMNKTVVDDSGDGEETVEEVRIRLEHQIREVEFEKKKLEGDLEEKLEVMRTEKRNAEKQLNELKEELENRDQDLSQSKKRQARQLAELHDTKLQLEEVSAKNHELEKKQRKFDSEMYGQQAETAQHKIDKDKSQREKENLQAQVFKLKNDLDEKINDLELSEKRNQRLEAEIQDYISRDDDDGAMVNQLKRSKRELEQNFQELQEEFDELLAENQQTEQARDRFQVQNERDRQQYQRQLESKDQEIDDQRAGFQKRIKQLEIQLEEEESERQSAHKQRKEAELKLNELRTTVPAKNEESERKLRRDIQRYRALLKDAQLQIEVLRNDSVSRAQLKQLQTQLEEASMNQNKVSKSKKSIEFENEDLVNQIEELTRTKQEIERQLADSHRERNDLCNRIEEQEEDLEETMQKYKTAVDNYNKSQSELVGVNTEFEALKSEKYLLEERVRNLQMSNQQYETNYVDKSHVLRAEARAREAETKLEFEKSTSKRLETQISRLKDNAEKYQNQRTQDLSDKDREKDASRKSKKALQEAREDLTIAERKYHESKSKVEELELEITRLSSTNEALQQDLKLAFKRISDLQQAFEALEDSDVDLSDVSSDDDPDNMTLYSSALPPVSRLGGSISRLDRDDQSCISCGASERPESSLTIGTLHSAITGLSTVGRAKKRMTGAERKKAAQKARKKLVKEMDAYQERSESRCASRAGSRPGSRSGSVSRANRNILAETEFNSKQAGADFTMDELTKKLSGAVSQIDDSLSRAGSPTGSMISETRQELVNLVDDFGANRAQSRMSRASTLRPGSRVGSRAGSRAGSPERPLTLPPARKENDPILRKLEDIDPYLLLHSTPEQLAKELGMRRTKDVGDINEEIEIIRTESRMGSRNGSRSRASDREENESRRVKVGAFADVTRQIDNMKTDHIRSKIFARHEAESLSDSCSNDSIKKSPQEARRKSILRKPKGRTSVDLDDEISPYDSISNAGRLKDRKYDFEDDDDDEDDGNDIANDIVRQTMAQYSTNSKKFNKSVGYDDNDISDEEEKLQAARGKKKAKKIVLSDEDDDDEFKPKRVPRKFGGKTLEERQKEDPLDLTKTRHRLLMPDPNDPLDPANIEKMLEARMKARRTSEAGESDDDRGSCVSTSSKASRTGEDWLEMAARAAKMSAELSALDAEPIDNAKFDRVYNDVLEKKKSTTPESDDEDLSEDDDEFDVPPKRQSKDSSESTPKFRSRFLDKVRGSMSEKPDQRKIAEDYIKGRTSRQSSEGSSNRASSRVSFTEPISSKSRKERNRAPSGQSNFTLDPDGDDVSLARFGVRCETATPISGSRKTRQRSGDSTISTSSNRKSDKVKDIMSGYLRS